MVTCGWGFTSLQSPANPWGGDSLLGTLVRHGDPPIIVCLASCGQISEGALGNDPEHLPGQEKEQFFMEVTAGPGWHQGLVCLHRPL